MSNTRRLFHNSTGKFLLWVLVFLAVIVSCQKDEFFSDPDPNAENVSFFKGTEIEPGKYIGLKGDCEWIILLPDVNTWNNLDNRYMVFYAHEMVDPVPYEEIKLPDDHIGDKPVEEIVVGNNMGYAATSYRDNGLVVLDAVQDIKDLFNISSLFF